MSPHAEPNQAYKQVGVETASQGKLIVMLFNGAIQRAEEAKRQIADGNNNELVHNSLIRAQEIIGELRAALNMNAGDVAANLDRIYEYFQHLLVDANIHKDTAPIDDCVELMTSIRDTWEEVFAKVATEGPPKPAPTINPHGSTIMNLQG
jgi:flagellar protein FliS